MQFRSAALSAIVLLFAGADARLDRLSVPKTIKAVEEFLLWYDLISTTPADTAMVAIAHGFAPVSSASKGSLGTEFLDRGSFVQQWDNYEGYINHTLVIPSNVASGEYLLTGSMFSIREKPELKLIPHLEESQVAFTVGDETSDELVQSPRKGV